MLLIRYLLDLQSRLEVLPCLPRVGLLADFTALYVHERQKLQTLIFPEHILHTLRVQLERLVRLPATLEVLRESIVQVHDNSRLLLAKRNVYERREELVRAPVPDRPLQFYAELEKRVVVVALLYEIADLAPLKVRANFDVLNIHLLQGLKYLLSQVRVYCLEIYLAY